MRTMGLLITLILLLAFSTSGCEKERSLNDDSSDNLPAISGYPIVGTNQSVFYNNISEISAVTAGNAFYGQNANYPGNTPKYENNGDGTITDLITGLMWQKSPDRNGDGLIDTNDKLSYAEAVENASTFNLGGYTDWRLPSIKEIYSLIMFSGTDIDPAASSPENTSPFINTAYFDFGYGDLDAGDRIIDAQVASNTIYVSTTMNGNKTMFGVNFADGRIKGYPAEAFLKTYYVYYVRGNSDYGINQFTDNNDGTVTDEATGLMWMQSDTKSAVSWEQALSNAERSEFAGHTDWRLPDAKELQGIVDYTRSPATTNSAAINPIFECTKITNEAGEEDYPYYWTSTTHASRTIKSGASASYVCFGRAMGKMNGIWIDVHGAGAQRSDPKTGNPIDFPDGRGPQGDAIRINNYVRLVRNIQ